MKLGADEALRLARDSSRVISARGSNVVVFNIKKDNPSDKDLLAALLGPTGNLRAPTMQVGKTLLVGFSEDAYTEVFG